ncbi:ComF family protein [Paenibacillus pasadenensis]|uniref:ComF family protein n=1 Tax=Paenibacillus pasadenensis TaxID=217090 RepID=UPI00203A90DB|nr:ComF family protein [Paenibacillus pasadenensis]MCM3750187.1 ComF family protein [Paenibacillus pasadenensis]
MFNDHSSGRLQPLVSGTGPLAEPPQDSTRLYPAKRSRAPFRWYEQMLELLSPERVPCFICLQRFAARSQQHGIPEGLPSSWANGICRSCSGTMPWIRKIKCFVCGRPEVCGDCCRRTGASFIRSRSAVSYTPEMRGLLARYKYRGEERLLPWLAVMLLPAFTALSDELSLGDGLHSVRRGSVPVFDLITSVPVSAERLQERGFNQAERLAASLSVRVGLVSRPLLIRNGERGKMSGKSRRDRLRSAADLFSPAPEASGILSIIASRSEANRRPLRLLLIDDIYTTGGTLDSCARALQLASPVPVDIFGLTWARA